MVTGCQGPPTPEPSARVSRAAAEPVPEIVIDSVAPLGSSKRVSFHVRTPAHEVEWGTGGNVERQLSVAKWQPAFIFTAGFADGASYAVTPGKPIGGPSKRFVATPKAPGPHEWVDLPRASGIYRLRFSDVDGVITLKSRTFELR
jgi:hypothetical protein